MVREDTNHGGEMWFVKTRTMAEVKTRTTAEVKTRTTGAAMDFNRLKKQKTKSINFIQNKIKLELQDIISGNEREGQESIIKTTQTFLRRNKGESSKNKDTNYSRKQEEEKLIELISKNNYWYSKQYIPENKIGQGAEQTVYLNEDIRTVTKLNDAIFYVYWLDYLNSLLIHNYFFPNTSYTLSGFKIEKETLFAVVEN